MYSDRDLLATKVRENNSFLAGISGYLSLKERSVSSLNVPTASSTPENSKPHVWQRRSWDNDVDLVAQSENPYRIGESKTCQLHPQQRLPAKAFWDTVC
jgi:hypothetical protein